MGFSLVVLIEAHISRLWYQRHGSGRVCHFSGYGSQPRLPGKPSIHVMRPILIFLEPQEAVPQALTLLGRARFIAWRLRFPLFMGILTGVKQFWECRACLGYGPVPRSTLSKALCRTCPLVGRTTNNC